MSDRFFVTGSRRDDDNGKPPLSKLPFAALREVALVHKYGDAHYGMGNWRKGQPFSVLSDSMLRHWEAWFVHGESRDPKSGLHHLAHCAWNALVLLYQCVYYRPELDDRLSWNGDWLSTEFAKTPLAKKLERGENNG